jgi:hypothetical protein
MTATFRISQGASVGIYGRARSDILPFALSGNVTFEAQTTTHTTYLWEIISKPVDGTAPTITSPTAATTTAQFVERDGYLVRLIVDAGLVTEDVAVLYLGMPLLGSSLPLPACYETNQDNSITPYDGSQGWWYKQGRLNKYLDTKVASLDVTRPWLVERTGAYAVTTLSVPAGGGTLLVSIDLGINRGTCLGLWVQAQADTSDTTIQLYSNVGCTEQLYEKPHVNCYTTAWEDRNSWNLSNHSGGLTNGLVYLKLTNADTTNASTYIVEISAMGTL